MAEEYGQTATQTAEKPMVAEPEEAPQPAASFEAALEAERAPQEEPAAPAAEPAVRKAVVAEAAVEAVRKRKLIQTVPRSHVVPLWALKRISPRASQAVGRLVFRLTTR